MLKDQHLLFKADTPAKGLSDACSPRKTQGAPTRGSRRIAVSHVTYIRPCKLRAEPLENATDTGLMI